MGKSTETAAFLSGLIMKTKSRPLAQAPKTAVSSVDIGGMIGGIGAVPPKQKHPEKTPAVADVSETPSSTASFLPPISTSSGKSALEESETESGLLSDANLDFVSSLIAEGLRKQKKAEARQNVTERASVLARASVSEFAAVFHRQGDDPEAFISAESFHRVSKAKERLRVAAYIRVSTDSSDQENSYETQERYFNNLLTQNANWISAGIYSDYGISGTDSGKRIGYRRILRHCEQGKIDRIVCKSVSRFARNTSDFMVALKTLQEHGVTILFEKEGLDTADPTSAFILTTLAAIAQEESRSISSNILWGHEKRYPKGDTRNHIIYGFRYAEGEDAFETTPTGYRRRRIVADEKEAEVVRRVFDLFEEGLGFTEIARKLNREHIPAPQAHTLNGQIRQSADVKQDIGWTGPHISRMVRSERYCGDVLLQKSFVPDYLTHESRKNKGEKPQYYVKGHHEAIISRDQFERVQKLLEVSKRNTHYTRTDKPFTHRLYCPHCGRYYHNRQSGPNAVWFCPTTMAHNGKAHCPSERIFEEQIIRMFRRAFIDRFGLVEAPVIDDVKVADIMSGCYGMDEEIITPFSQKAETFVGKMMARLRNIQSQDYVERDRGFLKRRVSAVEADIADTEKRIRHMMTELDSISVRQEILGDQSITEEELHAIQNQLRREQERKIRLEPEKAELDKKLTYLENYWEQLERDYDEREKTLEWMETLPEGQAGTTEFLNGLSETYIKGFALRITVHDPLHYTVHWFDDTTTEVEMYSNVEDHRLTLGDKERRWRELHGYGKR